jgi:hypothetical protein
MQYVSRTLLTRHEAASPREAFLEALDGVWT